MAKINTEGQFGMNGKVSISYIATKCLLSFGQNGISLRLEPLNVLVGPNGSGKSNFLEVFRLVQASADDIAEPIVKGGGVEHWSYKGKVEGRDYRRLAEIKSAVLKLIIVQDDIFFSDPFGDMLIAHDLALILDTVRPTVLSEEIHQLTPSLNSKDEKVVKFRDELYIRDNLYSYGSSDGPAIVQYGVTDENGNYDTTRYARRTIAQKDISHEQSILSQRVDPESYPALYELVRFYDRIFFYTDSVFGRSSPARLPQDAALDSTFLFPDASNLALVLNDLQNQPPVMRTIIEKLKLFYERAENIITRVQGGTVQIFFQEEGLTATVPASRLSDGTLRYLCLLVILCHPSPPPLICIEEPELGMHPDVLPTIAELLIEASQRTQLIITTHSDLLVSAIGAKHPEAIVVCEKGDSGTTMKRLEPEKMQEWLTRYSLGDLWLKGEIGGTRW